MDSFTYIKTIDFKGIIAEYVLNGLFDTAVTAIKKTILKSNTELRREEEKEKSISQKKDKVEIYLGKYEFTSTSNDIEAQLEFNLKTAFNWASDITFRDLNESKSLISTFIELDFYLTPRKNHFTEFSESKKIKLFEAIKDSAKNIIILGAPGAGKTTLGKYLCLSLLLKDPKLALSYKFPIIIRLRDFNQYPESDLEKLDLIEILLSILDLKLHLVGSPSDSAFNMQTTKLKIVSQVIESLKLLIVIDGFDEVINENFRKKIVSNLSKLSNSIIEGRIILTSRAADFNYSISNTWTYEICALSDNQIEEFTFKWLNSEEKAKRLQKQIFDSPYRDTAMRPLTLAHLCAIFERYNKIPEKPKSVYKKVISLLLEEWDSQRGIQRISKYSHFEVDRKIEFLSRLAFELTTRFKTFTFSKEYLEKCYRIIHKDFKLPERETKQVVNEIESHNGLIIQTGTESYDFAHKSLQEYLTADYVRGLDEIPSSKNILWGLPNELAITVTLSSDQTSFFSKLILKRLRPLGFQAGFITSFLTRLIAEKPDFSQSEDFGVAMLYLYSSSVSSINPEHSNSFSTIITDQIPKSVQTELEYSEIFAETRQIRNYRKLFELIIYFFSSEEFKSSLILIQKYYKVFGEKFSMQYSPKSGHYLLKYVSQSRGIKQKIYPQYLVIPETVANYFSKID